MSGFAAPSNDSVSTHPQNSFLTKSLSSWWRSFKNGLSDDALGSSSTPSRPNLFRASLSSSAVPGQFNRPCARQANEVIAGNEVLIPQEYSESPIFGVPLTTSLQYASARISLTGDDGESFVYGYVPVVIAKCSIFLKSNALDVEGIFRIPGSVRRIKVLQELFQTPPTFGKSLDWNGFNVHDAANLLKRYLSSLPHPIIPRDMYESFRKPLQNEFSAVRDYINCKSCTSNTNPGPKIDTTEELPVELINSAVSIYESLIFSLSAESRQLLLYLIDLLSVFSANSDKNRMSAYNLASIFQPSVLTVTEHDMNPEESQVSRIVIQFLIENSTALLSRVQQKAIRAHNIAKKNSTVVSTSATETLGANNHSESRSNGNQIEDFDVLPTVVSPRSSLDFKPDSARHSRSHSTSMSISTSPCDLTMVKDLPKLPGKIKQSP